MAYQERTTTNYGQRLLRSLKGIGGGFIMFLVGTIILFWNEGNFVKTKKAIGEAEKTFVAVSDVSTVDTTLNGKLIHAYALADTEDVLVDAQFGVNERAIAIIRTVEYYQFVEESKTETKDKLGGGEEKVTTYTYNQKWVSSPINSSGFKDPSSRNLNYVLDNIKEQTEYAKNVTFGAYRLPTFIIKSIQGKVPAKPQMSDDELIQWGNRIAGRMAELGTNVSSETKLVYVQDNVVYFGKSSTSPQIGDIRVTLTKIMPNEISIIAKVIGSTFEEYTTKEGRTFSRVEMGTVSAEKMFANAQKSNKYLTWILRLVGVILVVWGLKAIFNILSSLFKVLPFLGNIVGAGVGLVCTIGGVAWSLIIISISWLFYRPLIAIPMLLIAIVGIWFLNKNGKGKAKDT